MREWQTTALGEQINLKRGYDLPTKSRTDGNIPIYSSSGISGYHNENMCDGLGVITGRYGTIGKVFFSRTPYWPLNTTLYVQDFKGNDELFIYYFLQQLDWAKYSDKSAVPGVNRNDVHQEEVMIPPLPEQRAIAAVLSSLDDKIDLLHRQNKTLEAMAETLFRQWFVEEAGEDWDAGTLDDVISVKGGTTPSTKEPAYWDGDIHWTSPRDLSNHNSVFLFDTDRKITKKGLAKISSGLLPVGTVLLSSRAPIGYLAITNIKVAINQGYIAIICDKLVSNYFIYLWCKNNMENIKGSGNGSTFEEISKSNFKSLELTIPPKGKLNKFDEIASPIFKKIKANQLQIRTLEKMRDTLLPKLMSGEVRVDYA
ncbi:type I restriction enzyme, S subunit [Thiothrix eikelboomii]|uniref:Type I restriction enzyme, S subunit n=1 Tax=Thiothrix eikelboomii TaxID=92487 RepID=A0A1T4XBS2_9GAMM|nr:restriction endonuclease subunit S [Thiothrix eikelboomii]SKA87030.1 type I restriction enzyme, S subunit [Thiothrix eikelboomii]